MPSSVFLFFLVLELVIILGAIILFISRAIAVYFKLKEYCNLRIAEKYEYKSIKLRHKRKIKWQTSFGSSDRWKICALENILDSPVLIYKRRKLGA